LTHDWQKEYVARRSVEVNGRKGFCVAPLARAGGVLLVGWLVASSLWIYPHSLSYFNEAIGGPLNGAEHLLGSNLDWGQDLRYLSATKRSIGRDILLVCVCGFDASPELIALIGGLDLRARAALCAMPKDLVDTRQKAICISISANRMQAAIPLQYGTYPGRDRCLERIVTDCSKTEQQVSYGIIVLLPTQEPLVSP
jgi:hypothetical protein